MNTDAAVILGFAVGFYTGGGYVFWMVQRHRRRLTRHNEIDFRRPKKHDPWKPW